MTVAIGMKFGGRIEGRLGGKGHVSAGVESSVCMAIYYRLSCYGVMNVPGQRLIIPDSLENAPRVVPLESPRAADSNDVLFIPIASL